MASPTTIRAITPRPAPTAIRAANSPRRSRIVRVKTRTVMVRPVAQTMAISTATVREIAARPSAIPDTMVLEVTAVTPSTRLSISAATASTSWPGPTSTDTEEMTSPEAARPYLLRPLSTEDFTTAPKVSKFM